MLQPRKWQKVQLIPRVDDLPRLLFSAAGSPLACREERKRAALRRGFFGRWLTRWDDREHKSPDNDLCLSSHICHFSFGQYMWLYAHIPKCHLKPKSPPGNGQ
jgi:hypothetical protein